MDAGPKGAVITFRKNQFANPAALVTFITREAGRVKLRPDHKLVLSRAWDEPAARLDGVTVLVKTLASLASG